MIVISLSGKAGSGKDTVAKLLMERMNQDGIRTCKVGFADKLKDAACVMYGWDRARLGDDAYYKEGGLGGWVPKGLPGNPRRTDAEVDLKCRMINHQSDSHDLVGEEARITDEAVYAEGKRGWVELDIDPVCVALGMSRRTIMQRFGTECMRENMHQDHWIILVKAAMARGEYDDIDIGFVTDARFNNELTFAREVGGLTVRIDRVGTDTLTQHTAHVSEQEWQAWSDWDVIVNNNVSAGLDVLRQTVVDLVYTRLVQNGVGRFTMRAQRALVNGSNFGAFNHANIYSGIKPEDLARLSAAQTPDFRTSRIITVPHPEPIPDSLLQRVAQSWKDAV